MSPSKPPRNTPAWNYSSSPAGNAYGQAAPPWPRATGRPDAGREALLRSMMNSPTRFAAARTATPVATGNRGPCSVGRSRGKRRGDLVLAQPQRRGNQQTVVPARLDDRARRNSCQRIRRRAAALAQQQHGDVRWRVCFLDEAAIASPPATGWLATASGRTEAATLPVRPRTSSSNQRHPLAIALIVPSRSCIAVDGSVDAAQAGRSESPSSDSAAGVARGGRRRRATRWRCIRSASILRHRPGPGSATPELPAVTRRRVQPLAFTR